MKYGVGVRVEGRLGGFQGVQGFIQSRLKVGHQNLLVIRWSDGRESRATTGSVSVLAAGGLNEAVAPMIQANPGPQAEDVDGDGSDDEMSQQSEGSNDSSEGDMGDQDGYKQNIIYLFITNN